MANLSIQRGGKRYYPVATFTYRWDDGDVTDYVYVLRTDGTLLRKAQWRSSWSGKLESTGYTGCGTLPKSDISPENTTGKWLDLAAKCAYIIGKRRPGWLLIKPVQTYR